MFQTLLIIVALSIGAVENRTVVKVKNLNCTSMDESFINYKECKLKPVSPDVNEVTIHAALSKLPINDLWIAFDLRKRGYNNAQPIYSYTIDLCAFMRNTRRNPVAEATLNVMGFFIASNINHTCPYNHDMILNRFRLDNSLMHLIPLPVGEYKVHLSWFSGKKTRAIITIVIRVFEQLL